MRTGVALLVAAVALAAPATAAAPSIDRQVRVLQRQVKSLRTEVRRLRAMDVRLSLAIQRQQDLTVCYFALGRDTDDGQFVTLGLIVEAITGVAPPPQPARFDDQGACERIGVTRP